jgi:hypothetical protein
MQYKNIKLYYLIILFLFSLIIINPYGNYFYGQDDWSYAWSTLQLYSKKSLVISNWSSAIALPQIILGGLFSYIFGFSIQTLNISTSVYAIICLIVYYKVNMLVFNDEFISFISTFLLLSTPIFLGFSISYMSDMSFLTIFLISIMYYLKYYKSNRLIHLSLASFFCFLSVISRQIGISILFSYFIIILLRKIKCSSCQNKRFYKELFIGLVLPVLILILCKIFPIILGGTSIAQKVIVEDYHRTVINFFKFHRFISFFIMSLVYNIFLASPVVILLLILKIKKIISIIRHHLWLYIFNLFIIFSFLIIWGFRIKSFIVYGDLFQLNPSYNLNYFDNIFLWNILILISGFTLPILLTIFILIFKNKFNLLKLNETFTFILIVFTFMLSIISVSPTFYNNYFLSTLPLFIIILFSIMKLNKHKKTTTLIIVIYFIFSNIYIENHVRNIQGAWNLSDKFKQKSKLLFSLPSWYAWNNYQSIDSQLIDNFNKKIGLKTFSIWGKYKSESDFKLNRFNEKIIIDSLEIKSLFKKNKLSVVKN